jgi:sulfate transport system permease protein
MTSVADKHPRGLIRRLFWKRKSVLPGFNLSMGITLVYLSLIVLIPLSTLFLKTATLGWSRFFEVAFSPRAIASYELSFGASLIAALVNAVFGVLVAWVLVRYRFFGKGVIDALVDLPFALPTAVGGIALTTIYAKKGWVGQGLARFGIEAAFSRLGVVIALIFVGLPFVVRTVQPVLEEMDLDEEEAAATLGATRFETFRRVTAPAILPAVITGFALSFARAVGEYGSVVFISGNMPLRTEITPLLIMTQLLLFVNRLQAWSGVKVSR